MTVTNAQAALLAAAILVAGGAIAAAIGYLAFATDFHRGQYAGQIGAAAALVGLVIGIVALVKMRKGSGPKE